jgi:hypothetical protein
VGRVVSAPARRPAVTPAEVAETATRALAAASAGRVALERASTPDEAQAVVDGARVGSSWLRAARRRLATADPAEAARLRAELEAAEAEVAEVGLRAEVRLGELLGPAATYAEAARRSGNTVLPLAPAQKMLASRARKAASARALLDAYLAACRDAGRRPCRAGLLRAQREAAQAEERARLADDGGPAPVGPGRPAPAAGRNRSPVSMAADMLREAERLLATARAPDGAHAAVRRMHDAATSDLLARLRPLVRTAAQAACELDETLGGGR